MTNFLAKVLHLIKDDTTKVKMFLTANEQAIEAVISFIGKEFIELGGSDKMVKAINFIETFLKVPAFIQVFTPEIVAEVEAFIQSKFDELRLAGKI